VNAVKCIVKVTLKLFECFSSTSLVLQCRSTLHWFPCNSESDYGVIHVYFGQKKLIHIIHGIILLILSYCNLSTSKESLEIWMNM